VSTQFGGKGGGRGLEMGPLSSPVYAHHGLSRTVFVEPRLATDGRRYALKLHRPPNARNVLKFAEKSVTRCNAEISPDLQGIWYACANSLCNRD